MSEEKEKKLHEHTLRQPKPIDERLVEIKGEHNPDLASEDDDEESDK